MTPDILEQDLAAEITTIFEGFTLKNSAGKDTALKVFVSETPIGTDTDSDDAETQTEDPPEPYVVVKANSGNIASEDDPHVITVVLVICTYDDATAKQGHKDLLHIIFKIYERFAKDPSLGAAVMKYPVDWVLQEEDTYPYYFGGLQLQFELPAFKKEDKFA